MNNLQSTELFDLLAEGSKVPTHEMKSAYETFVYQVQHLNQSENDYDVIFRILNFTRIEYESLQVFDLYEQGKKCA